MVGIQKAGDPAVIEFLKGRAQARTRSSTSISPAKAFMLGERPTIVDISMAGYLYYPEETGFDRSVFKNVEAW
jgi:glutathione S-transferase